MAPIYIDELYLAAHRGTEMETAVFVAILGANLLLLQDFGSFATAASPGFRTAVTARGLNYGALEKRCGSIDSYWLLLFSSLSSANSYPQGETFLSNNP